MTAKEYLQQLRTKDVQVQQLKAQLAELQASAATLRGIAYDGDPVQTSQRTDANFVDALMALSDLEQKIAERMVAAAEERAEIIERIHKVRDALSLEILYKRYVQYKPLSLIAGEVGYAEQYVRTKHGHALLDFANANADLGLIIPVA